MVCDEVYNVCNRSDWRLCNSGPQKRGGPALDQALQGFHAKRCLRYVELSFKKSIIVQAWDEYTNVAIVGQCVAVCPGWGFS